MLVSALRASASIAAVVVALAAAQPASAHTRYNAGGYWYLSGGWYHWSDAAPQLQKKHRRVKRARHHHRVAHRGHHRRSDSHADRGTKQAHAPVQTHAAKVIHEVRTPNHDARVGSVDKASQRPERRRLGNVRDGLPSRDKHVRGGVEAGDQANILANKRDARNSTGSVRKEGIRLGNAKEVMQIETGRNLGTGISIGVPDHVARPWPDDRQLVMHPRANSWPDDRQLARAIALTRDDTAVYSPTLPLIGRATENVRNIFHAFFDHLLHRPEASPNYLTVALKNKLAEIQNACVGFKLISTGCWRGGHSFLVRGSGRPSLHCTKPLGKAADFVVQNWSCAYALLKGWKGGYSLDPKIVKHIHFSDPNSREAGVRFCHHTRGCTTEYGTATNGHRRVRVAHLSPMHKVATR